MPVGIQGSDTGARLSFEAKGGRVCFVETSDDLANWIRSEPIEPDATIATTLDASVASPAFAHVFESAE